MLELVSCGCILFIGKPTLLFQMNLELIKHMIYMKLLSNVRKIKENFLHFCTQVDLFCLVEFCLTLLLYDPISTIKIREGLKKQSLYNGLLVSLQS